MLKLSSARLVTATTALAFLATACPQEPPAPVGVPNLTGLVRVDIPKLTEDDPATEDVDESGQVVLDESGNPVFDLTVPAPINGYAEGDYDAENNEVLINVDSPDIQSAAIDLWGTQANLQYLVTFDGPLSGNLETGVPVSATMTVLRVVVGPATIELASCAVPLEFDLTGSESDGVISLHQEGFTASSPGEEACFADGLGYLGTVIGDLLTSPYNEVNLSVTL